MRRLYPRIATAFALYLHCRSVQTVHYETKKDRGRKVEHKFLTIPTGYHALPWSGGILDQPVWTMEMFATFRRGETSGAQKAM